MRWEGRGTRGCPGAWRPTWVLPLPTGFCLRTLDLPVSRVTSCCFGGPDYAELYVTSAAEGLSPEQLQREPQAGHVFKVRASSVGASPVCGEAPWEGSPVGAQPDGKGAQWEGRERACHGGGGLVS